MCARIIQTITVSTLNEVFKLQVPAPSRVPTKKTWNGPPSRGYTVCRHGTDGRELTTAEWGLRPRWMQDGDFRAVNARSETAHEKPSFQEAFRLRRCILPVNGWYEWPRGSRGQAPFHIAASDEDILLLAGLWEPPGLSARADSFAVLTTEPRQELARIHHRQPSVIAREEIGAWLNPHTPTGEVFRLARSAGCGGLRIRRVDRAVNNPLNDSPSLLA